MSEGDLDVVAKTHRALRAVNILTMLGGIGLLTLSIWPGYAIGCWLILAFPLIALLGLAWLFMVIRAVPKPAGRGIPIPPRQILIAPILVCTTYALLTFYVPRRIVFRLTLSQFEKHLPAVGAATNPATFNRWLGPYRVDKVVSDPRGGVFFRSGTQADMIDLYSFGFAYQPNATGSPFGNAHYAIHPITKDWYWFQANNDW